MILLLCLYVRVINNNNSKDMLRELTKVVKFLSGFHTQRISNIMKSYNPQSQSDIISTLQKISTQKQYTQTSPITQSFINKIEYFLLKKQNKLTTQTLYIYQSLKQMNFLTPRFRYGMLKILCEQMQRVWDQGLQLRGNQLEILLWFLWREFPVLRGSRFGGVAGDFSLRLFQMYQFMNQQKKLPMWEPYLRITTMLKSLGHEIAPRNDITPLQISRLQYLYLPFLTHLFPTPQSSTQYRQTHNLHEPLFTHLSNQYIDRDKIRYDRYIHYVQKIDNEETHEEIQHVVDPLNWDNFVQLFQMYVRNWTDLGEIDTHLGYNLGELFWRLCQSKNVELEAAVRMIEIVGENPGVVQENVEKMIMRIKDAIQSYSSEYFKFLPGRGFIIAIASIPKLQRLPDNLQHELVQTFVNQITESFLWQEGQKLELLQLLEANQIEIKPELRKFLTESQ